MSGRRTNWARILAAAVLAVVLTVSATAAQAIEIENVVWGFDGKVVPNQFNPMSVLVFNPSAEPFDGQLELRKSLYQGTKGAPLIEPVFVSPFTKRWVQFYPFIQRDQEEWKISWKPGFGRARQPYVPTHGTSAHVLLEAPGSLARGGSLRMFNEELFPPFVSATAGLASVTFDHQPRWEKPRRDAFIDWIHAGGNVHILYDSSSEFPKFTEELSALNTPVEKFHIGAGTVYRHSRMRSQLDRAFVNEKIHPVPEKPTTKTPQEVAAEEAAQANNMNNYNQYNQQYEQQMMFADVNQTFLKELKGMTRPDHNWIVIHLMSIVYILVVFPGCWLIGRKWRDYRITLGVLLGGVALFSLGFREVGRRGYGEETAVHTVAIARPLAGGQYDVMAWSNLFVTTGDDYAISQPGTGRLFSTAQENESVRGQIKNGAGGGFVVDIPPFSSREFVSRFQGTAKPIQLTVDSWESNAEQINVTLTPGPNFPAEPEEMFAVYRKQIYRLQRNGKQLMVGSSAGELLPFLNSSTFNSYNNRNTMWGADERPIEQIFRSTLEPLIARQLGINTDEEGKSFSLPDDRVRLFVFAPLPEEFGVVRMIGDTQQNFQRQVGRVLYCFDVFNPKEL
ncbi:MAG: hypothetical protein HON53_02715 [Planctomycetaceae bacterium]|jgi:hypothetical protein|nr:hypothetical protein [Planctomycetaceae bacterium]MBT6156476.1 hypothetical protein [Planctomycetaceae bacterium]MBT6485446.1 hypothetical protein [Planctomycetaceae bacterium]MBT6497242.1 hypothetical protein [Planctomycetaceae bacterium]